VVVMLLLLLRSVARSSSLQYVTVMPGNEIPQR